MRQAVTKLVTFSRFINAFVGIERVVPMPGTNRMENDVEHSYHLAVMAWYLIDSLKLNLDLTKVLMYALAHDLVEVHAGDTYVWSTNKEEHATKKDRESAAAEQIKQDFPEFSELHTTIASYEHRNDQESRFVYALDKILPMVLIMEDEGRLWKKMEVTLDMITRKKAPQVALSPEIEPYFNELLQIIRESKLTADLA